MDLPRLVMKFGGTSVGDPEAIRRAGGIVAAAAERQPAVVVSAAGGLTDQLLTLMDAAADGGGEAPLGEITTRHHELIAGLGLPDGLLDGPLAELGKLVRGIALLRELTPRTSDKLLSYGERLMAPLFAAYLRTLGMDARPWVAGDLGLRTDDRFTRARPLPETYELIPERLRAAGPHVPVVTGYLGETAEGHTTTLGRGGSDYSASILARAVRAEALEIWTDVDGILTADPRLVPGARLIERLSFQEAGELAYSGAKVLHPSTITPAMEGRIPVQVRNTLHPDRPGTTIIDDGDSASLPKLRSIAHKSRVQVVTVVSPRMLARHGFLSRIAEVFDRHHVSIDMISTSEVSVSLTTDERARDMHALRRDLETWSEVQIEEDLGLISVVGGGLGEDLSLVADILRTVTDAGADVDMISYGTTRTNFSFLVRESDLEPVVRALHARYFEE